MHIYEAGRPRLLSHFIIPQAHSGQTPFLCSSKPFPAFDIPPSISPMLPQPSHGAMAMKMAVRLRTTDTSQRTIQVNAAYFNSSMDVMPVLRGPANQPVTPARSSAGCTHSTTAE